MLAAGPSPAAAACRQHTGATYGHGQEGAVIAFSCEEAGCHLSGAQTVLQTRGRAVGRAAPFPPLTKAGGPRSFSKDEGVQCSAPAGTLGAQLQLGKLGEGCCGPGLAVLAASRDLEQFSCFFLWLTSQTGDQEHYSCFQGWELFLSEMPGWAGCQCCFSLQLAEPG